MEKADPPETSLHFRINNLGSGDCNGLVTGGVKFSIRYIELN